MSGRSGKTMNFGLDVGTKNIVLSWRDEHNKMKHRSDVNGFCVLKSGDAFARTLLKQQHIPFLEREDRLIALGQKAEELAYALNQTLQRPMSEGVINGDEEEALMIMSAVIKSLLRDVGNDADAVLYYCIPGNALNKKLNVGYHQKIVQLIIDDKAKKMTTRSINEARALILGGVEDKTGVGISWGAGMVNVSYCLFGLSIFEFALVGSGDWIDQETARVVKNETPTSVCKHKENRLKNKRFNLKKMPEDNVGRALYINYGLLMENVLQGIAEGFKRNEDKARIERPIPIIVSGGTSSPDGFIEYFKTMLKKIEMPFEINDVIRAHPLHAVADGCLVAAEMHQ
ncbi:MAG: hypothetical protein DRH24_19800 [Deltaproteobacteria bacterium]|nr:MAG: hypothetical protein DRH24_19800 [Deltaproteobacteria bacterium]